MELLMVIAILVVLSGAAVVIFNPYERFSEARDSERVQELNQISSVLSLVYEQGRIRGDANTVYISLPDPDPNCSSYSLPALPSPWVYKCATSDNYLKPDGFGWIPVNFGVVLGGSPLQSLPIDPENNADFYYAYVVDPTEQRFVVTALMESESRLKEVAAKDGGTDTARLEVGTKFSLWAEATGIVGYWSMDEGGGNVIGDASGKNNNGTLNNSTWITGKVGKAIQVNSGGWASIPSSPSLSITGNVSIALWVNGDSPPAGWTNIISKGGDCGTNNRSYIAYFNPNSPAGKFFFSYLNCGGISSNTVVTNGNWYHVVATHSQSTDYVYVNGRLEAQRTSIGNPVNTASSLTIGAAGYRFDDVRVYNRPLSAKEIEMMYKSQK